MDVVICMSSGEHSVSPVRDEEDDGIFSWGGVSACVFRFHFHFEEEWGF